MPVAFGNGARHGLPQGEGGVTKELQNMAIWVLDDTGGIMAFDVGVDEYQSSGGDIVAAWHLLDRP